MTDAKRARIRLTNDDEPGKLTPRSIDVLRTGMTIGEQPAVLAAVDPPLEFGEAVDHVLLASRTHGVTVDEIILNAGSRPGRVYVCRYSGGISPIPDRLSREDVRILFWGLIDVPLSA